MKVNKFIFVCLLLAILTVGAVSAADNATDEISLEEETVVDSPIDEAEQVSQIDEDALEKSNWDMDVDDTVDVFPAKNQEIRIDNCPEDAKGNFSLAIDEINKECAKESNSIIFDASKLTLGQHNYALNFLGDDKYNPTTKSGILNVVTPLSTEELFVGADLYLDYENGDPIGTQDNLPLFYDDEEFNFEEYFKKGGNFTKFGLEIDGKIYDVFPVMIHDVGASERFIRYVALTKELPCGNYLAKLNFNNEHYKVYNLTVVPYNLDIGEDWTYGDFIRFMYSNNLTGYIKIEVNSKEVYNKNVNENSYSWSEYAKVSDIDISKYLKWGSNEVSFKYYGGNYQNFTEKVNLTYAYTFYLENMTFYYGSYYSEEGWRSNHYYLWDIPEELSNDKLSVKIDGVKYSIDYINQEVDISQLDVGYHTVVVSYKGDDKFYPLTEKAYINVTYPKISIPKTVTNGNNEIVIVVPGKNATFKITAKTIRSTPKSNQNTYEFSAKLVNGQAKVSLAQLSGGKYVIDVEGRIDGKYYDSIKEVTVKNTKLAAKDTSVYYKSGNGFKVKVTTAAGKVIKNKYVKFYINGKYVKKVKTTKNGYATLKIAKVPGSYKITAKYGKVKITRKLTVKHAVTLKAVTVKKSAKKLVLTATLKQGKKALKNKKVTFKFNGKTYKAKTNKKGVAKVTIKKAVLKKLKVGKNVAYQATYLKDTVKKTAKVKK